MHITPYRLPRQIGRCCAVLLGFITPHACIGHEGPPFPILMDQEVGQYELSVWADPDIGEARFFVLMEPRSGIDPNEPRPRVTLWFEPVNGRLARVTHDAQLQPMKNRLQYYAEPFFDQRDFWRVGVLISGANVPTREFVAEVESTPPGLGPWDLLIYSFPFVLFGGLWVIAYLRHGRAVSSPAASDQPQ